MSEIFEDGGYNNAALKRVLKSNGAMSREDRALVTETVNGTLRNIIYIDYLINAFSKTKTQKIKPRLLVIMRLSVYQLVFTDKIPAYAVCDEAVKLAKKRGYAGLSGFVNGVLRAIARGWKEVKLPSEKDEPAQYLSVKYSHPSWLVEMWLADYGFDFTKALCEKNNASPDVTVIVNKLKYGVDDVKSFAEKNGAVCKSGKILPYALRLSKTSDIAKWDIFQKGGFHVQDESSALAVEILSPQKGERVLDVCSAPGGKAALMAEKMQNDGYIEACDIYPHKLELIEETARRLGLGIIKTKLRDATESFEGTFDKVLVDAPCSGFGLMAKKPDMRLKKSADDIKNIAKLQLEILRNASKGVKEGGYLLYSACTISKEENERNIEKFLSGNDAFCAVDLTDRLPEGVSAETAKNGYIRLFPNVQGTDGFFICLMKRRARNNG